MASTQFTSTQTALAIIPPPHIQSQLNSLRALYDRAFTKWPAHLNLVYPFVSPTKLPETIGPFRTRLRAEAPFEMCLECSGVFKLESSAILWLGPSQQQVERCRALRRLLVGEDAGAAQELNPHATLGQTSLETIAMESLLEKAKKLASQRLSWTVDRIAVLERDRDRRVRVVDELWIGETDETASPTAELPEKGKSLEPCFSFDGSESWTVGPLGESSAIKEAIVLTYNVLEDSESSHDRYPILVDEILSTTPSTTTSASPAILCLQEVSDSFLSYILDHPRFRTTYKHCSQGSKSVLPSLRNCVVFSTIPFTWQWLSLSSRHKTAVVASFPGVVVGVVHLTCGLSNSSVAAKAMQMKTLKSHLQKEFAELEWIVAGDFNLTSSVRVIQAAVDRGIISPETEKVLKQDVIDTDVFLDCWELAYLPTEEDSGQNLKSDEEAPKYDGETGATFDALSNPLAAERAVWISDSRPQRYDRVLVKRNGNITVREATRFGFPGRDGKCGSDHYGLTTTLNFTAHQGTSVGKDGDILEVNEDETDLHELVKDSLPRAGDRQEREDALRILKGCLKDDGTGDSDRSVLPIILASLGSYALDVYSKDADIDCICVSTITRKTFFQLARQRIKRFPPPTGSTDTIKILRFADGVVPHLELKVNSIKIDLQYCQAPDLIPRWPEVPLLSSSDPLFYLPPVSLKTLNAYRDAQFLLRTIPNLKVFRLAHRFLQLWAKSCGVYASRFGILGGVHLTLLLSRVCKLAPRTATAAGIVRAFFDYYASFDWAKNIVCDPSLGPERAKRYQRASREAMAILSIHTPTVRVNVAQNATKHIAKTVADELRRAKELLDTGKWDAVVGDGVDRFLQESQSFLRIDLQCWGSSQARGLIGWVESRCPLLLIELQNALPSVSARLWPARFRDNTDTDEAELRGYYLVALSSQSSGQPLGSGEKKAYVEKLISVIRTFEHQMQETALYDPATVWIQVSHVASATSACIDTREWCSTSDEAAFPTDEHDRDNDDEDDEMPLPLPLLNSGDKINIGVKLRPAHEILHRIRWDPELDVADYVVGYEDRFVGMKELPVSRWKTEQTDLEFIPLHRVAYFRRRSDAVVVWAREGKVDLLSGS